MTITLTYTNPDLEIIFENLPEKSQAYLAQYGLNKSLQDSASGTMKAAETAWNGKDDASRKYTARIMKSYAIDPNDYTTGTLYAEAVALAQKNERLDNILAGEVELSTTGPRLRGIDAVMFDVAVERLKVAFGNANKKWPQEAATVKELVGKYLAKYGEDARKEAERRMAATVEPDLEDILS